MADMHAKGRGPLRDGWGGRRCGENNPFAKLSDDQVRAIRRLSADGLKSPAIAGNFGVSPATVRDVLTGRGWSHVQ
jgi:DNA-binding NarL/FixJ family response regulator